MKILVTGAAGFVGANLIGKLHGNNDLLAVDVVGLPENLRGKTAFMKVGPDIPTSGWEEMADSCDAVVHLAQSPHYREFPEKAEEIFTTNVATGMKLLEASRRRKVKVFIFFSSGGIYGFGNDKFRELDKLNPVDFYLATKGMMEFLARKYREFLSVHIVRPFFIYGPGQKNRFIPSMISRIRNGEPVFLNGRGDGGMLNPVFIDDVVCMTEKLLKLHPGNATTNFAGPDVVSVREIIGIIGGLLGKEPLITRAENGRPSDLVADISRIKETFGDIRLTPIREGLKRTVEGAIYTQLG